MNKKSLELWQHRIADRKSSGLNVIDWCKKNNLTKHAYYYWLKRIEVNAQNTDADTPMPIFAEIEPSFITRGRNVKSDLQITWKDVNITISDSDTVKLAAEFISQLQKLCQGALQRMLRTYISAVNTRTSAIMRSIVLWEVIL